MLLCNVTQRLRIFHLVSRSTAAIRYFFLSVYHQCSVAFLLTARSDRFKLLLLLELVN